MNVATWEDENLAIHGDYEALVLGGVTLSSRQLHDRASRLASALIERGIAPGDRVILFLPTGPELFVSFSAVLRAGAVAVVMHETAPATEIERVASHCAPAAIVAVEPAEAVSRAAAAIRNRIAVRAKEGAGDWLDLGRLIETSAPLATPVPRSPEDAAQLVYTSGTTGAPKAIAYTHGNVAGRYPSPSSMKPAGSASSKSVVRLMALHAAHALGGSFLYLRLVTKSKVVCLEKFEPQLFLAAVEQHRVATSILVPAMCEALVAYKEADRFDVSSLRTLVVGGAAVSPSLIERFEAKFKLRLSVSYGLTEVPGATLGAASSRPGAVGRLAPGVEARIVGERGEVLPPGEHGEVQLKSAWVSFAESAESAESESTSSGEWFATGDIGYLSANRELFIVGRNKEQISQGGVKVFPQEIIEVLRGLDLADCAVVGVPSALLGEEIVACVVRDSKSAVDEDAVLAECRKHLDPRKVPTRVEFFDELPKTAIGKVKTFELRAQVVARAAQLAETERMANLRAALPSRRKGLLAECIERALQRVIPDASDHSGVTFGATFGDRGLDSIRAVQFANRLSLDLGVRLSPTLTFDHPTVEALAAHLEQTLFAASEPVSRPAKNRVAAVATREPIAIVGAGCRLPGKEATVDAPERFWEMLHDGVDTCRVVPPERWNIDDLYDPKRGTPGKTYTREASFIHAPDAFDAEFFGVSPVEARALDPQHRLLLEAAWSALEDAGIAPRALSEAKTGVFVGITGSSYTSASFLGLLPCMAAGRLSHFLDLSGPSLAIDTACSSSLVAVHDAVQSLRRGECDAALVGGVHVMASPRPFIGLAAIQALAADGRCKTFDASADGYGRGEGCVVLLLKRLSHALADGDRVLAVIRGSAVNHDARSSSLTAPNGRAQRALLEAALEDAGVSPDDVDYLEAHGTGTPLGDPIELSAAVDVLCRDRDRPLVVGSVKTNIGHLEAAAGVSGLLKTALSLAHGEIPPHLHLKELNPILAPLADRIRIPREATKLPRRAGRRRIAGVTSLGFSGTNAHVILEEPPDDAGRVSAGNVAPSAGGLPLLCVSARSEAALERSLELVAERLAAPTEASFADLCFTANAGRAHFAHRAYVIARGPEDARKNLLSSPPRATLGRAGKPPASAPSAGGGPATARPKIAFLFTGQGSQYVGMGRALYASHSVFRNALDRCAEALRPLLSRPLLEVVHGEGTQSILDDAAFAQPALFALEWSLSQLWQSWGIEPDWLVGHSLGEYVAACVGGAFSVEDGLRLVAERGRLTQALPSGGAMASLAIDEERARHVIEPFADRVSVAAVNADGVTVVSGAGDAIAEIGRRLAAEGVSVRPLRVAYAYHSPLVEPILDEWQRVTSSIRYEPLRIGLVSTLTGKVTTTEELSAPTYWRKHMREAVRFARGLDSLVTEGCTVFLEVGPNPSLVAMARQHLEPRGATFTCIASMRRDRADDEQIAEALGELYLRGLDPTWSAVYQDVVPRRVALPGYPFERKSFWSTGQAPSLARPSGQPATPTPRREAARVVLPAAREERIELIVARARTILSDVLGCAPDSITPGENLLERGLDSLRVMDFLARLERACGLKTTAAHFMARSTLDALAAHLADQADPRASQAPRTEAPRAEAPRVEAPRTNSPLVVLRREGSQAPLVCLHPAGGQATAYLRFRTLLGDEQPLYAIQSRACMAPELEHASLHAMAIDYATLVQSAHPSGPFRLLGWSMGGFVAHAVAAELERRGEHVEWVAMIDARPHGRFDLPDSAMAVLGALHDLQIPLPDPKTLFVSLGALADEKVAPGDLLAWCRDRHFAVGDVDGAAFERTVRLFLQHLGLLREHEPPRVRAKIRALWAGTRPSGPAATYWSSYAARELAEQVVTGNHFTVMKPPHVDELGRAIASFR